MHWSHWAHPVAASNQFHCVHGQAKAGGKKLPPASLTVSPAGLRIVNMASEAVLSDLDIYRSVHCVIPSESISGYLSETDCVCTPSVLWHCWLGGRKGIRPVKNWAVGCWCGICLDWGADLHMAQLMPLPLTVSCFSKIQIGLAFLVPAHPGSPGQRAIKRVCDCVCKYSLHVLPAVVAISSSMLTADFTPIKSCSS